MMNFLLGGGKHKTVLHKTMLLILSSSDFRAGMTHMCLAPMKAFWSGNTLNWTQLIFYLRYYLWCCYRSSWYVYQCSSAGPSVFWAYIPCARLRICFRLKAAQAWVQVWPPFFLPVDSEFKALHSCNNQGVYHSKKKKKIQGVGLNFKPMCQSTLLKYQILVCSNNWLSKIAYVLVLINPSDKQSCYGFLISMTH